MLVFQPLVFQPLVFQPLAGKPSRDLPAIDHETLPGDKAGVVGGEKGKQRGHVRRPA